MKFVLVADAFPPMRTSAAVQLRDLAREFVAQGHDLTILIPSEDLEASWEVSEFDGARVIRLAAPKTKDIGYFRRTINECIMPYAMLWNLRKSPAGSERWEGVIWYSPSIFHAPLVRAVKHQSECKSYLILRDIFPDWALDLGLMRPGMAYAFLKKIAQQQYLAADIIGVQSPGNLDYFDWLNQSHSGARLEVLQNWLAPPARLSCSLQLHSTTLSGRKTFVYAGNMGAAQGLDILIELATRLKHRRDIGFLFVGRGTEARRLKAAADKRGLENVLFHDEIDPDEIPNLYAQCAAGIVCLDRRHQSHNIPGKFLTYMQNGLPALAIVNAGNDLATLIRDGGVGEVCESHDVEEIAKLSLALLDLTLEDNLLSTRCRQLFEQQFSVSQSVEQIVASLKEAK